MIRIRKVKVGPLKGLWVAWCNCTFPNKHRIMANKQSQALEESLEHLRDIGHI